MKKHFENYLVRALHDAKIAEIVDSYKEEGFKVEKKIQLANQEFDLVLRNRKSGKVLVFEVKMLPLSSDSHLKIERIRKMAEQLGFEFRLVTISKPTRYSISIDWFDGALLNQIREETIHNIEDKATHIDYQDVESELLSVEIQGTMAKVKAIGEVAVELQYGSDSDMDHGDGMRNVDTFPFEGEFELDLVKSEIVHANIRVDDSEWNG